MQNEWATIQVGKAIYLQGRGQALHDKTEEILDQIFYRYFPANVSFYLD